LRAAVQRCSGTHDAAGTKMQALFWPVGPLDATRGKPSYLLTLHGLGVVGVGVGVHGVLRHLVIELVDLDLHG